MTPQCIYCPCDHGAFWIHECCLGGKSHLEINEILLQIEGVLKAMQNLLTGLLEDEAFISLFCFVCFLIRKETSVCISLTKTHIFQGLGIKSWFLQRLPCLCCSDPVTDLPAHCNASPSFAFGSKLLLA